MQSMRLLLCENNKLNTESMLAQMCDYPFERAGKEETRESGKGSIKRAEEKTTRKR